VRGDANYRIKILKRKLWFHRVAFIGWAGLMFPGTTIWKFSVLFVIIQSGWANLMTHESAIEGIKAALEALETRDDTD
jgi:hypothetical protein